MIQASRRRPIGRLTWICTVALWPVLICKMWWIGYKAVEIHMIGLSPDGIATDGPWDPWNFWPLTSAFMPLIAGLTSVAAGVLVLRWMYRANLNSRALARGLEITPFWAVVSWIVPIISLFMPYQAMSEISRVAHDPERWKSLRTPSPVGWWWALHISGAVVLTVVNYIPTFSGFMSAAAAAWSVLVGYAIQGAATLLFLALINSTAKRQDALIASGYVLPEQPQGTPSWAT